MQRSLIDDTHLPTGIIHRMSALGQERTLTSALKMVRYEG